LNKSERKRKPASLRRKPHSSTGEPPGEGGPNEATSFTAESPSALAALAARHNLDHLQYLPAMARLEAEEHIRLRSKRRLSWVCSSRCAPLALGRRPRLQRRIGGAKQPAVL
jgi:hypothetical protein